MLFLERLKLTSDPSERTDFPNFRSLLWRAMAQFPDRVEPRSRELSPLLLRFIRSADTVLNPNFDHMVSVRTVWHRKIVQKSKQQAKTEH